VELDLSLFERVFLLSIGCLEVFLVLLSCDAFVFDEIDHADNDFNCLYSSEKDEQNEGNKELDQQVLVKDNEDCAQNDVPKEEFTHINHLHYLPSVLQAGVLPSNRCI